MFTKLVVKSYQSLILWISLTILTNFQITLHSQSHNPNFSPFIGSVYDLPVDSLPFGYQPYIEYLVPVDKIVRGKLNIQERSSEVPFPGLPYTKGFGIIFKSKMRIDAEGTYEFILISDDGSKLWIDDELISDNDLPHKMRMRRDTTMLKAGEYPIKLWYYQAYPSKYGILFDSNYIGPVDSEADTINWKSEILFGFDEDNISDRGTSVLDSFINFLQGRNVQQIEIIGHTDSEGASSYNYDLSQKRAKSIVTYLEKNEACQSINFLSIGRGEDHPVVPNDTGANRARNRRVEIVFY